MREDAVTPGDIAVGVIIGRTSEFFDFFVYAIASVIVFPKLMFPALAPLDATWPHSRFLRSWPVRSADLVRIDQKYGRGVKLTIALVLLGGSTAAISFLPGATRSASRRSGCWPCSDSDKALRWAEPGTASLAPHAQCPRRTARMVCDDPAAGRAARPHRRQPAVRLLHQSLDSADFLDWGWRYPFFCAFAINVVALFARLRIVDPLVRKAL
jgi:hypothetical protein